MQRTRCPSARVAGILPAIRGRDALDTIGDVHHPIVFGLSPGVPGRGKKGFDVLGRDIGRHSPAA